MRAFLSHSSILFISLSLISTGLLSACSPSGAAKPSSGTLTKDQVHFAALTAEQESCQRDIRAKMAGAIIGITDVPELRSEILSANGASSTTHEKTFKARMYKSMVFDLRVFHAYKNDFSISYKLERPEKDTSFLYKFTTEATLIKNGSSLTVTQEFNVDQGCHFNLATTSALKISQDEAGVYNVTNKKVAAGKATESSDKFTLPENAELANLKTPDFEISKLPQKAFIYFDGSGLKRYSLQAGPNQKKTEFNLDLNFKVTDFVVELGDGRTAQLENGQDNEKAISFLDLADQTLLWTLPEPLWQEKEIFTDSLMAMVNSTLPQTYFWYHNAILLETRVLPLYPHFAAYWKTVRTSVDKKTGVKTLTLLENEVPTYKDTALPEDLESNDTIQVNLPQIQKIKNDIQAKVPVTNRRGQIAEILKYLGENYTFDHEMETTNTTRPMSTEEALSRGKGVCQHYSVIFNALARALKIPARIVQGYYVDGPTIGNHVWVEAEVEPGLWQVIEPQNSEGLTQTKTRNYIPFVRAWILENKNVEMTQFIWPLMSTNYSIRPVN